MGKQFKKAATDAQPVYSTIIGAAQGDTEAQEPQEDLYAQEVATPQEIKEAQEAQRTQGRRGFKAMRINMAFTPTNSDYIRVMAAIRGMTMTAFVNDVMAREVERNGETYRAAKALIDNENL